MTAGHVITTHKEQSIAALLAGICTGLHSAFRGFPNPARRHDNNPSEERRRIPFMSGHFTKRRSTNVSILTTDCAPREPPVIDISGLTGAATERNAIARKLRVACADTGFFYVTGHGVTAELI